MKTKTILLAIIAIAIIALPASLAFAGSYNQNDEDNGKSVERGTGKVNGLDGCAPPTQSGNYWVFVPTGLLPPDWSHEWEGGPCCPSNNYPDPATSEYPYPNQCCNGPDYLPEGPPFYGAESGEHAPGNHCLCFGIRGWPHPPS